MKNYCQTFLNGSNCSNGIYLDKTARDDHHCLVFKAKTAPRRGAKDDKAPRDEKV